MKYDVEKLLKMKNYGEAICAGVKIEQLYLSRTIRALNELEELEAVLATPQRTSEDIAKRMKLVKDLRKFYAEQLDAVATIRDLTNNIAGTVETEYNLLFKIIKA